MGYFGASKMQGASWFWVSGPGLLSIQNVACQMTHFKRFNASNLWGRNANWLLSGPVSSLFFQLGLKSRWCCLHRKQNWGRKLSEMVKWGERAHKLAGGRYGCPGLRFSKGRGKVEWKFDRTHPHNHKSPDGGKALRAEMCWTNVYWSAVSPERLDNRPYLNADKEKNLKASHSWA